MLELDVVPGERVGPFVLGLSESELEQVYRSIDGLKDLAPFQVRPRGTAHYAFHLSVKARIDRDGLVQAIQVSGSGSSESFLVRFQGMDLLGTPADEVMEFLSGFDSLSVDEFRFRAVAPQLGLVLSRSVVPDDEDDEDGRYFTAVLAAKKGSIDLEQ
jgi:hypothetical protein